MSQFAQVYSSKRLFGREKDAVPEGALSQNIF